MAYCRLATSLSLTQTMTSTTTASYGTTEQLQLTVAVGGCGIKTLKRSVEVLETLNEERLFVPIKRVRGKCNDDHVDDEDDGCKGLSNSRSVVNNEEINSSVSVEVEEEGFNVNVALEEEEKVLTDEEGVEFDGVVEKDIPKHELKEKVNDRIARLLRESAPSKDEVKITKENTHILLDWDDTLLPSTWLFKQKILPGDTIPPMVQNELIRLDQAVAMFLTNVSFLYGKIQIVTNAQEGWVEKSSKAFLPQVANYLEMNKGSISILSARAHYEFVNPNDPAVWKEVAFHNIVKELVSRYVAVPESENYSTISSVADRPESIDTDLSQIDLDLLFNEVYEEVVEVKDFDDDDDDVAFQLPEMDVCSTLASNMITTEKGDISRILPVTLNVLSVGDSTHDSMALASLNCSEVADQLSVPVSQFNLVRKTVRFCPQPEVKDILSQLDQLESKFAELCTSPEPCNFNMWYDAMHRMKKKRTRIVPRVRL